MLGRASELELAELILPIFGAPAYDGDHVLLASNQNQCSREPTKDFLASRHEALAVGDRGRPLDLVA